MHPSFLSFNRVSFSYDSQAEPLFSNLTLGLPAGWTGIVGANGSGKSTLLLLAVGAREPSRGVVSSPGRSAYCAQRTDDPPGDLDALCATDDHRGRELKGRLGIRDDWAGLWTYLSHGERKRAQIACALWSEPFVLAVDEPTNHVDARTRDVLCRGLRDFRGIGLLVSHDRALLDELCRQCIFLDTHRPPEERARVFAGSYSHADEVQKAETARARERYAAARQDARALAADAIQKRMEAAGARARLSKRGIDRKDRDSMGRIDMARISGRDRTSARLVRETEARRARAEESAGSFRLKKEYDLALWFQSERARRDVLFSVPAQELPLGESRRLRIPVLCMRPADRVALTGPNGSGKSTLVRFLVANLHLPDERLVYVPQELEAEQSRTIAAEMRHLAGGELGRVLTVVNLLGSDPKRILQSAALSPGETRKVMLAIGIARVPHFIVMDEPTNHLDLPSIDCLKEALAACACGLLLVSHDEGFLRPLATRRWEIEGDEITSLAEVMP